MQLRANYHCIPANFFWDVGGRFLSWECWDSLKRHDHFRRFPKKSEVFRRRPKSYEDVRSLPKAKLSRKRLFTKSEIARKVLSFIHFTHGFRSLHGSELTYFWKLCQARRQQLTFFNQAWEIGPQAWAGVRSKFSTRRRESWQVYHCAWSMCLCNFPPSAKDAAVWQWGTSCNQQQSVKRSSRAGEEHAAEHPG